MNGATLPSSSRMSSSVNVSSPLTCGQYSGSEDVGVEAVAVAEVEGLRSPCPRQASDIVGKRLKRCHGDFLRVCDVCWRNARAAAATISSMSSALVARQTWQAVSGESGSRTPTSRMAARNARVRSEPAAPQARRHVGPLPVTVASTRASWIVPRSRSRKRVRVRTPRLTAAARRGEAVDQVPAAGERSDRVAVRHRFAEHREVGRHADDRLVAAEVMAERGLPLIEHQERPVPRRELTHLLEECASRRRDRGAVEVRRKTNAATSRPCPAKAVGAPGSPMSDVISGTGQLLRATPRSLGGGLRRLRRRTRPSPPRATMRRSAPPVPPRPAAALPRSGRGERGSVVYRGIAVADDGRAVGQEIVNEAPATRCPEVAALAAHDELVEPAAAYGGSGQHAGGTSAERRAVGQRLRRAGHLLQRRAGRVPRAPAKPPDSSPGYALTGQR
jgi:hypothetical protein